MKIKTLTPMMQAIIKLFFFVLSISLACACNQSKETMSGEKSPVAKDTTHHIQYIMGHFDPPKHPLFEEIDIKYADRAGMYLRKEALSAFKNMWEAAKEESIDLKIASATRNFNYQKRIWENKWTGKTILSDGINAQDISSAKHRALKILLYSSMPGTSRHHWGTDIDLNTFNNSWFETGEGLQLYTWLLKNAHTYGFCQVYTAKGTERPYGYEEEKWHWSYLPISRPLTLFAKEKLENNMISGFLGAESAEDIDVVNKYVLGVHDKCMKE